jgi:hypothetical protein
MQNRHRRSVLPMSRTTLLSHAATLAPGILQVSRSTWIAVGVGLLCLFGLLAWAVIAVVGGLLGQAGNLADATPKTARVVIEQAGRAIPALEQAERVIPGVSQALEVWRAATKPVPPPQDVSGTDPTSVARYPGLVRTHWSRDGQQIAVRYEGSADYAAVLREYATGFAKQGYSQNLLSASPDEEKHEYAKGSERIQFSIARGNKNTVKVGIVTLLPRTG